MKIKINRSFRLQIKVEEIQKGLLYGQDSYIKALWF